MKIPELSSKFSIRFHNYHPRRLKGKRFWATQATSQVRKVNRRYTHYKHQVGTLALTHNTILILQTPSRHTCINAQYHSNIVTYQTEVAKKAAKEVAAATKAH